MAELQRVRAIEGREDWQGCAVLARSHRYLWPLQAWCEQRGVPYFLAADRQSMLPLTRQRAFTRVVAQLRVAADRSLDAANAARAARSLALDPVWREFFDTAFDQLAGEFGGCHLAPATIIDWLYDYAREMRQQPRPGLFLGTVHAAKGLEFRHVALLDGAWDASPDHLEEARRLYYVGMTRAEETLTLCEFAPGNPFASSLATCLQTRDFNANHDPALDLHYQTLGLKDIDLGFPGRQAPGAPMHDAIRRLEPGDALNLQVEDERLVIRNRDGRVVGRTSRSFRLEVEPETCEVGGIVTRFRGDTDPDYLATIKCEQWELVMPRLKGRRRA